MAAALHALAADEAGAPVVRRNVSAEDFRIVDREVSGMGGLDRGNSERGGSRGSERTGQLEGSYTRQLWQKR